MVPIWITEGRNELSDHRNIWDWIKYNKSSCYKIFQKQGKGEKRKTIKIWKEYTEAKQVFETNPNDSNGDNLNAA